MKIYILTPIFLIIHILLISQPFITPEWVIRHSGVANKIINDKAGNIYIGGNKSNDIIIIKYNTNGIQQWEVQYNGTANGSDYLFDMTIDTLDNIYVTGYSYATGTKEDIILIKFNSSGIRQWVVTYNMNGSSEDMGIKLLTDKFLNIYVSCITDNNSGWDLATLKFNPQGSLLWIRTYNNAINDVVRDIALDKYNSIYITGYEDNLVNSSFLTIKYDTYGNQMWVSRFDTSIYNESYSLTVDDDICTYVTGNIILSNGFRFATIKYDSSGIKQWVVYNDSNSQVSYDIILDSFSNVYITGNANVNVNAGDIRTVKYNKDGELLWQKDYNSEFNKTDFSNSIISDNYGNLYVSGISEAENDKYDYLTIKYDTSGTLKWTARYDGPDHGIDVSTSITIDRNFNVFLTGNSQGDICTIKYNQLLGITPISNNIPDRFELFQNYPNPFNPTTKLRFAVKRELKSGKSNVKSKIQLVIYNTLGQVVATLVNDEINAGIHEVEFNGNNFASGVYFYSLIVGDNIIDTKKMLLLK